MFRIKELQGFSDYVLGFKKGLIRFLMSFMNIETVFNRSKSRYTGDIVKGLNRIIEIKQTGFCMEHDVYPDIEKRGTPTKKVVKLVHFPVNDKKPFALVIAGGAYQAVSSASESFTTCTALNEMGYHAFSLNYRVGKKNSFPVQVEDLHEAIKYIIRNADKLNVKTIDYSVIGFSAGGHLAGTLMLDTFKMDGVPYPKCIAPNYPALFYLRNELNILGADDQHMLEVIDKNIAYIEEHFMENPPRICWYHCKDDSVLPAYGSQKLESLLGKCLIMHQYMEYPSGGHGCGLATLTSAEGWLESFVRYWQS